MATYSLTQATSAKLHFLTKVCSFSQYIKSYENFILLGEFNLTTEKSNLKDLMNAFCLENLIREPSCYNSTLYIFHPY